MGLWLFHNRNMPKFICALLRYYPFLFSLWLIFEAVDDDFSYDLYRFLRTVLTWWLFWWPWIIVCVLPLSLCMCHTYDSQTFYSHTQSTHTLDSSSEHQKSTATNKILYSGKLVKWNSSGINLWRSNPFNTIANVGQIELKAFIRDWIRFVKYFLIEQFQSWLTPSTWWNYSTFNREFPLPFNQTIASSKHSNGLMFFELLISKFSFRHIEVCEWIDLRTGKSNYNWIKENN